MKKEMTYLIQNPIYVNILVKFVLNMKLSVVIPVFNNEGSLKELQQRLKLILHSLVRDGYEVIYIDDGSTDNSFSVLKKIAKTNNNIRLIRLSRNFGQHIAIHAGLDFCTGQYIVLMDADLQEQPEDISKVYFKIKEGYDIVVGVRESRRDAFLKKITSRLFFYVMNIISGIRMIPNQTMLRIFNRQVLTALRGMQEYNQNNGAFLAWLGFKQTTVYLKHKERAIGKSQYSFWKLYSFALDAILGFSNKPLIYISLLGLLISVSSVIYACYIITIKYILNIPPTGWSSLAVLISFLGGLILFSLGVIGLYIGRIYKQSLGRPLYVIGEKYRL